MARVGANNTNDALAADDLALVTDLFDAGANLHIETFLCFLLLDTSAGGIERRQLNYYAVSRSYLHSHLSNNTTERHRDLLPILQLHLEETLGKRFKNYAFNFFPSAQLNLVTSTTKLR